MFPEGFDKNEFLSNVLKTLRNFHNESMDEEYVEIHPRRLANGKVEFHQINFHPDFPTVRPPTPDQSVQAHTHFHENGRCEFKRGHFPGISLRKQANILHVSPVFIRVFIWFEHRAGH